MQIKSLDFVAWLETPNNYSVSILVWSFISSKKLFSLQDLFSAHMNLRRVTIKEQSLFFDLQQVKGMLKMVKATPSLSD